MRNETALLKNERKANRQVKRLEKEFRHLTETMTLREAMQRERESGIFSIHTAWKILREHWFFFFLAVMLCFCLVAFVSLNLSLNSASAVMSLNYEESIKGLNPNGSRFNLSEFRSHEVLEQAIALAGLQDELTVEELSDMISITPYTNGRLSTTGDNYYINSSFRIRLTMPMTFRWKITPENMLQLVCKSYKETFQDEYIVTASALKDTDADLNGLDYNEISSYLSMMIQRALRYLDVRETSATAFISSDGATFKSLRQQVVTLRDYELNKYNSYIWENGLSKDLERRMDTLNYRNSQLQWNYKQAMEESTVLRQIVEDYNNAMTSSVLIPTYDSGNFFYMARTKTGIDDITKEADNCLSEAYSVQKSIMTNEDKLQKLALRQASRTVYQSADALAERILEKLDDIIDHIVQVDYEYNREVTGDYVAFKYDTQRLSQVLGLKKAIIIDILLCGVLYLLWAVRNRRKARRLVTWMQSAK